MLDQESARSLCLLPELTSTLNNETERQTWGAIDSDHHSCVPLQSMRAIRSSVVDQGSAARDHSDSSVHRLSADPSALLHCCRISLHLKPLAREYTTFKGVAKRLVFSLHGNLQYPSQSGPFRQGQPCERGMTLRSCSSLVSSPDKTQFAPTSGSELNKREDLHRRTTRRNDL